MTIMDTKYNNNGGGVGAGGVLGLGHDDDRFGDTKVFVGGLAWETRKEALREEFEKYGEILEAVVISDKLITARSKGYGFVTFKEAEAAKKASLRGTKCDDQWSPSQLQSCISGGSTQITSNNNKNKLLF